MEMIEMEIMLEKSDDMRAAMTGGVRSTPGLVVDERVVHAGGIPRAKVEARA